MFWVREVGPAVFACDEDLLGKVFREGEVVLRVNEAYRGRKVGEKELKDILRRGKVISLVGPRVIAVARELGYVDRAPRIGGVEHINVYKL